MNNDYTLYMCVEAKDFVFDTPYQEFEKTLKDEIQRVADETFGHFRDEYVRRNSAGVWESDEVNQSAQGDAGESGSYS
jgi:hypothetical protein